MIPEILSDYSPTVLNGFIKKLPPCTHIDTEWLLTSQ